MASKAVIICISAVLVQSITGNCVRPILGAPVTISNCGGPFIVTSISPVSPSGIAVATDLALAGELALEGALPYVAAVAFEGSYPTSGTAAVAYSCGDGTIGITQELGSNVATSVSPAGLGSCPCKRY